ncbi:MAG: hypothetical protein ACOXZR_00575 [Bacilli bacterium]
MLKKYKWLILSICIIIVFSFIYFLKTFVYYNQGTIYGNRLKGIKEVKISQDLKNDLVDTLKHNLGVKTAKVELQGRILNILIEVEETVSIEESQTFMINLLPKFTEKIKEYYDLHFYITKDSLKEEENLPLIGVKSKFSSEIVWSKV